MNRIIHNDTYKLTRILFSRVMGPLAVFCALLLVSVVALLMTNVNAETYAMPYEGHIENARVGYAVFALLCLAAVYLGGRIYADNFKNGGVYTIMMLPMRRRNVFFAHVAMCTLFMLVMFVAAALTLAVCHPIVTNSCQHAANTALMQYRGQFSANATIWAYEGMPPFDVSRDNGFFLAVIRSGLLRVFLPQNFLDAVFSLILLLSFGVAPPIVAFACKKSGAFITGVLGFGLLAVAFYFRGVFEYSNTMIQLFVANLCLLAALVAAVVLCIRRLDRDCNFFQ
ncbi:ABC transporter permease [Christensenellaceae bacterium OttesenSCG-928-M15]|nr:ABC transporter permease [Christensenellaceae bacterium OttesenSCG-928-M15]